MKLTPIIRIGLLAGAASTQPGVLHQPLPIFLPALAMAAHATELQRPPEHDLLRTPTAYRRAVIGTFNRPGQA